MSFSTPPLVYFSTYERNVSSSSSSASLTSRSFHPVPNKMIDLILSAACLLRSNRCAARSSSICSVEIQKSFTGGKHISQFKQIQHVVQMSDLISNRHGYTPR